MAAELTKPYPVHRPLAVRCGSPLPSALAFPEKVKRSAPRKRTKEIKQRKKRKKAPPRSQRPHSSSPITALPVDALAAVISDQSANRKFDVVCCGTLARHIKKINLA